MVGVILCHDEKKGLEASSILLKTTNRVTVGIRIGIAVELNQPAYIISTISVKSGQL